MEDNKTLLMMVLKQHFKGRFKVLEEALQVIKGYSEKNSTQNEYEEILKTLREKMNDLPDNILLYFLSLVPLPKSCTEDYESSLIKEMKQNKFQSFDSIRPKLIEYLNVENQPSTSTKQNLPKAETELVAPKNTQAEDHFKQPRKIVKGRRTKKNAPKECKSLLDICAEYVIKNQSMLNQLYKHKKEEAWRLVNSGKYDKEKVYEVIKDVNRKAKLMRMVDCEEIPLDIIYEEYGDSEIFLRESGFYNILREDPFELSKELRDAIIRFVYE